MNLLLVGLLLASSPDRKCEPPPDIPCHQVKVVGDSWQFRVNGKCFVSWIDEGGLVCRLVEKWVKHNEYTGTSLSSILVHLDDIGGAWETLSVHRQECDK